MSSHNSGFTDGLSFTTVLKKAYDADRERLRVDAEVEMGDINIGTVEIKDGTTDDRLTVNPDGSINVNSTITSTGTKVFDYFDHGTVIQSASSDHTYVVGVGQTIDLTNFSLTGSGQWKAEIFIDATPVCTFIGTRARPSLDVNVPVQATAGQTVKITMTNLDPNDSQCFYTSLYGVVN